MSAWGRVSVMDFIGRVQVVAIEFNLFSLLLVKWCLKVQARWRISDGAHGRRTAGHILLVLNHHYCYW